MASATRDEFDTSFLEDETSYDFFSTSISNPLATMPSLETFSEANMLCDANSTSTPWAENYLNGKISQEHETNPTISAMQQLSELSSKLFTEIHGPTPSGDAQEQTGRLEQLAASVIKSSVTFGDILNHAGTSLASGTATVLQILTAYLRLTELHLALYLHIQSTLSPNTPLARVTDSSPISMLSPPLSDSTTPTIFPTLHIGGVSLASYSNFQLKFILQICVHHLGEIETILGLPAAFCVQECCGSSRGIFHQYPRGTEVLIQTIMTQAGETLKGIRTVLRTLKDELRGSIEV